MKTVKWFKEGDKIPSNGKLIKTEDRARRYQPPTGGYATVKESWFLYEVEYESSEDSPRYRKAMDTLKKISPQQYYKLLDELDKAKSL